MTDQPATRWPPVVAGVIVTAEQRVVDAVKQAQACGLVLACDARARFACVRHLPRGWRAVFTDQ